MAQCLKHLQHSHEYWIWDPHKLYNNLADVVAIPAEAETGAPWDKLASYTSQNWQAQHSDRPCLNRLSDKQSRKIPDINFVKHMHLFYMCLTHKYANIHANTHAYHSKQLNGLLQTVQLAPKSKNKNVPSTQDAPLTILLCHC